VSSRSLAAFSAPRGPIPGESLRTVCPGRYQPAVLQTRFSILLESFHNPTNRRMVHFQHLGGFMARPAMQNIEDHQVTNLGTRIADLPQILPQPLLDRPSDLKHNDLHGNSIRSQDRFLRTLRREFPFFYSDYLLVQLICALLFRHKGTSNG